MRMTFDEIKAAIKGKPKKEQIKLVELELKDFNQSQANERLKGNPPMTGIATYKKSEPKPEPTEEQKKARSEFLKKQAKERKEREERQKKQEQKEREAINKEVKKYTDLIADIEARDEAHARKMQREDLKPFMCDRPMDWYFNKENIPNQKLLFELFDEIEKYSFNNMTTDDFINILFYYREFINDNAAEPFKPISRIKAAPLNQDESQLLYRLILKSFGNLKPEMKVYSALMLIERMVNETNGNAEIECTELSSHFIIPMDNKVSSPVKGLVHFYAGNKISRANAKQVIDKNKYRNSSNKELSPHGFADDCNEAIKNLNEWLSFKERKPNDNFNGRKYDSLISHLNEVQEIFKNLKMENELKKVQEHLKKLS